MPVSLGAFDLDVYAQSELASIGMATYFAENPWSLAEVKGLFECDQGVGIYLNGQCVGGAVMDETHCFHIAVLPIAYGRWGRIFPRVLDWAWQIAHPFYAVVYRDNQQVLSLFRWVQSKEIARDDVAVVYEISRSAE